LALNGTALAILAMLAAETIVRTAIVAFVISSSCQLKMLCVGFFEVEVSAV